MAADPARELPLYRAAADVLVKLHSAPLPELPLCDADWLTDMAAPAFDFYAPEGGQVASAPNWVGKEAPATYWRPYGYPSIMSADESTFTTGKQMPRWDIPEEAIISCAINGAFFTKDDNPNQCTTAEEIIRSAEECIAEGAQNFHLHDRDERGYNILTVAAFRRIIETLKQKHPEISYDACLVAVNDEEYAEMVEMTKAGLIESVPINTTALILGDNLFVKPPHVIIDKTRMVVEAGLTPQLAVYSDADIDNARRFLVEPGLVKGPISWLLVPGLPGCSPMWSPETMVDGLMRMVRLIREIDPEGDLIVCAGGRAGLYLANMALLMGLHVRIGMEDTVWKYPHRDEKISSNVEAFKTVRDIALSLGRRPMPASTFRERMKAKRSTL